MHYVHEYNAFLLCYNVMTWEIGKSGTDFVNLKRAGDFQTDQVLSMKVAVLVLNCARFEGAQIFKPFFRFNRA